MTEYDKNGEGLINATESLWSILLNVMQDPRIGSVITILDALDECAGVDYLLRKLNEHFHSN
jgi:hypothetical protein